MTAMLDNREAILARLLTICAAVDGIRAAYRNKTNLDGLVAPFVALYDGDEEASEDPTPRPVISPRRVAMTPQILAVWGAPSSDVGTDVNALRSRIIDAIMTDATLAALTLNGTGVRYEGCSTELAHGRAMTATVGITFTFTYMLRATIA